MTSNFAGSFAPYAPPPDDPSRLIPKPASHSNPWFSASYQSGGLPSLTVPASTDAEHGQQNDWETTHGLRVDVLAAFAYLLGPISAFVLLVLEVHSDYVRFHGQQVVSLSGLKRKYDLEAAYQAALLMTPLVAAYILAAILRFPSWICSFIALLFCVSGLSMATLAFLGAYRGGLSRYRLPKLGSLADRWVDEE